MKMEEKNNSLSPLNSVVKSNRMIESIYSLSAIEQKLILSLCSKISSNDNVFNDFKMTVNEFANFLGIDNSEYNFNRTVKKKCEDLASKTITINNGTQKKPDWLIFNWFNYIRYESGKGVVSMKFHEKLEPYLLNIQEAYTKYRLGYVMNFKCEHTFRIYELLKEYEKIGERTLPVEELKLMMFSEKGSTYSKYSHFKARVILPAIREINKYSDLEVELIAEEKEAKKVVGLVFSIRNTKKYKYPIDTYMEWEELNKKTKEEIQELFDNLFLKEYKINYPKIKTDLFVKEAILQTYQEIKEGEYDDKDIKSPLLYFRAVLIKKHAKMTGEEITNTMLSRYEIMQLHPEIMMKSPKKNILDEEEETENENFLEITEENEETSEIQE